MQEIWLLVCPYNPLMFSIGATTCTISQSINTVGLEWFNVVFQHSFIICKPPTRFEITVSLSTCVNKRTRERNNAAYHIGNFYRAYETYVVCRKHFHVASSNIGLRGACGHAT
jgi:hypothetical protein